LILNLNFKDHQINSYPEDLIDLVNLEI
jgi:hypothetical protein